VKAYTVRGTSDEVTTCDQCGRQGLKSTVALEPADGSDVVYFGSDCAAVATGWTVAEVGAGRRSADRAAAELEAQARAAEHQAAFVTWEAWLVEATGEADVADAIRALGGFAAARALYGDR
jgi:hypothetical protein